MVDFIFSPWSIAIIGALFGIFGIFLALGSRGLDYALDLQKEVVDLRSEVRRMERNEELLRESDKIIRKNEAILRQNEEILRNQVDELEAERDALKERVASRAMDGATGAGAGDQAGRG